jgi:hypothetical protein
VLSVVALLAATPAAAKTTFDGAWSVSVVTSRGDCGGYSYPIRIDHGGVGGQPNVSGRVADNGVIWVLVGTGSRHATGSGRLFASAGSGTWRAIACSGTWTAEKL